MCQQLVDRSLTVSESDIANAMRYLHREHNMVVEGAAGVAYAGMTKAISEFEGRTVAVIICGGNVPQSVFADVIGD